VFNVKPDNNTSRHVRMYFVASASFQWPVLVGASVSEAKYASLTPYYWQDAPFVACRSLRVLDIKSASV
jgi:hypothetical protein